MVAFAPREGRLPWPHLMEACPPLGSLPPALTRANCQTARLPGTFLRAHARAGSPPAVAACQSAHVRALMISGSLPGSLPEAGSLPPLLACGDLPPLAKPIRNSPRAGPESFGSHERRGQRNPQAR